MAHTFHTLDVFTTRRFGGNPLAVVLNADGLTTEEMQTVTREFNLSETVFVMKPEDAAHTARIRIFFPGGEMPFAGHPTVGTAILLAELKNKPGCSFETLITLEENAGLVPVKVTRIADTSRAMFTAPVVPFAVDLPLPSKQTVAQALLLDPEEIGFDGHGLGLYQGGPRCFYVPVKSRAALAGSKVIEPHWSEMIGKLDVDMAYLFTRGGDNPKTAFRSRMYAPTGGIPEDPATGAATAILAAHLLGAENLGPGTHKYELEQGYEMGRPSDLHLEIDVAGTGISAVRVAGSAVRVSQGTIVIR
ncbi:MAG: PhzF family phenazine biosynthesis protein [Aestuariivirga sp.]